MLINGPPPAPNAGDASVLVFRPSQAPEQGGLGPVNREPTGQG